MTVPRAASYMQSAEKVSTQLRLSCVASAKICSGIGEYEHPYEFT